MNYDYLPADKRPKYSYNEAVVIKLKERKKLSSNIPGKENPANFNKKITDACIQGYNLVRYLWIQKIMIAFTTHTEIEMKR